MAANCPSQPIFTWNSLIPYTIAKTGAVRLYRDPMALSKSPHLWNGTMRRIAEREDGGMQRHPEFAAAMPDTPRCLTEIEAFLQV